METKRLILAVVLAVAVLLVFQYFFMPKPAAAPGAEQRPGSAQAGGVNPQAAAPVQGGGTPGPASQGAAPDIGSILGQEETPTEPGAEALPAIEESLSAQGEQTVTVDGPLYTAVFTNRGAGLSSFMLKRYKDDAGKPMDLVSRRARESGFYPFYFLGSGEALAALNKAFFVSPAAPIVTLAGSGRTEVVFEYADAALNLKAVKKFSFTPGSGLASTHSPGTLTVAVPPGKGIIGSIVLSPSITFSGNSTVTSFSPPRRLAAKSAARP